MPGASWDQLKARLGSAYDVDGARQAGLSEDEVASEGDAIASDLQKKHGQLYDVQGAWKAGLSIPEIQSEVTGTEDKAYGTMSPAPERGVIGKLWQGTKNAWRGAGLDADPMTLDADRGLVSKGLSTIMAPAKMAIGVGGKAIEANEALSGALGGAAASKLAQAASGLPEGPRIVPVLTGLKGTFPYVEGELATPKDVATAGAGLAVNLGTDPLNYMPLGKGASALAGEAAAGEATKQGALRVLADKVLPTQLSPSGIVENAEGLMALGRGVGRVAKALPGAAVRGAELAKGAAQVAGEVGAKGYEAVKDLLAAGKGAVGGAINTMQEAVTKARPQAAALEDALATVNSQPKTLDDLGAHTRIKDLVEVFGRDATVEAELAMQDRKVDARTAALLRQQGMDELEIADNLRMDQVAREQERRAAQGAQASMSAKEQAAALKTAAKQAKVKQRALAKAKGLLDAAGVDSSGLDLGLEAQADTILAPVHSAEIAAMPEATVDQVLGNLNEESETFQRWGRGPKNGVMPAGLSPEAQLAWKETQAGKNSLANSVKYLVGRGLADPSSVLPRMANEAGRVFDKMNRTKDIFYQGLRAAFEGLDETDKMVVGLQLDTHAKDWEVLNKYGLRNERTEAAHAKVRALLDKLAEVEGLQPGQRVGDYFPHLGLKESKGAIQAGEDGVAFHVPARSWLPRKTADTTGAIEKLIAESATGKSFDPEKLLGIRINAGLRKAYFNPLVEAWTPRLSGLSEGGRGYAEAYMNKLLGRQGEVWQKIDTALQKIPWGKGDTLSVSKLNRAQLGVTMAYYRGLLGLAVDTAFKNLGQVQNTVAELGYRKTATGIGRLFTETFLTPEAKRVFAKSGIIDDYEHIVAANVDTMARSSLGKAMDKVLFTPMKFSEYVNRGVAFHAGLAEAYGNGMKGEQALTYAKAMVDKTQFRYGVTNTSPYLQNPFGKLWYQFGSYPLKEAEFINQVLKDPNKRKLYRLLAFHGMVMGTGAVGGAALADAMGYTPVAIPFTGDADTGEKRMHITLPLGIFPHLGVYTSPAMKALGSIPGAAGEIMRNGYPGPATQDLINNVANTIPGRRYLGKLWDIYHELGSGTDSKPPKLQENVVSVMRGKGLKDELPGGPGSNPYGAGDAVRESLGIEPKGQQEPIIPGILYRGDK